MHVYKQNKLTTLRLQLAVIPRLTLHLAVPHTAAAVWLPAVQRKCWKACRPLTHSLVPYCLFRNGACRTEPRLGTEQNPPCLLISVSIHLPVHRPVAILPSGTKTGLTESLHLASSAFGISGKTSREHHVRRRQSTSARRSARPSDIWYAFCYQLAAVTTRDLARRSNHRFSSARYKKPSPRSVGRLIRSTKSGQMV